MLNATSAIEKNKVNLIKKRKKINATYKIAIVDLGTNSVRFDVYRIGEKGIARIHREKIMIRLGDGVFKTGKLSSESMLRATKAFLTFKKYMTKNKVDRVVAFGTSALRTATNSKQFIDKVKARTGIQVRVISGKEEGGLIALGILSNIKPPKGHFALVDIGGGSTEISICLGRKILSCHSFKLGANRLQQLILKSIPPKFIKGQLHPVLALRQHLKTELSSLAEINKKYPIKFVIGSSGTIRTVSKILKRIGCSGQPIYRSDLSSMVSEMQVMTREQLLQVDGLEPKRVDLILAGAILLEEILFAVSTTQVAVTDFALRDGILQNEILYRN